MSATTIWHRSALRQRIRVKLEARGRGRLVWPAVGAGALSSGWHSGRGTGAHTCTSTAAGAAMCPCLHRLLNMGWCPAASVRRCEALVPDLSSHRHRLLPGHDHVRQQVPAPAPTTLRSTWTLLSNKRTRQRVCEGNPAAGLQARGRRALGGCSVQTILCRVRSTKEQPTPCHFA
jgi:hypothetical protein